MTLNEKETLSLLADVIDEKAPVIQTAVIDCDEKAAIREVKEEKEKEAPWVAPRDAAVAKAIAAGNVPELARLSALPGGFGSPTSRRNAWIALLRSESLALLDTTRDSSPETETDTEGIRVTAPHDDENQVLLDTRRSFVTYPRDISSVNKAAMQEDLQHLIVSVLQRHPRLGYFQGFHDIMTVLYLTLVDVPRRRAGEKIALSDEERLQWAQLLRAAEVVALCRTRDAMGKGLAPMMGMLRLLRRLLAVADPQLYRVSASISPVPTLPFFALSWILTLFSHDVDTLEPVQRIFDYLMARNPITAIYLAVAILIAKKPQMARLVKELGPEAQRDPSLLHPLFARLPPLYPDTPDAPTPPPSYKVPDLGPNHEPNPYTPIPLSTVFALSDKLVAKYPWDGPKIRAGEVLGAGSMVRTYEKEGSEGWSLKDAEHAIDNDVILPGGDEADEEDDLIPRRFDRLGTALTLGIVVIGVGAVFLGVQRNAQMARFWAFVAAQWSKSSAARSWLTVSSYLARTLRDVL